MTATYEPPPIPGTSSFGGSFAPTQNPYFTLANQFLPRNLHDVIRWARYITLQSPVTTEVLRKYSTYPVTDFVVDSTSKGVRDRYEEIIKRFQLKSILHDVGFEYHSIGNVFLSIYFPISRTLTCPSCKAGYSAKTAKFLKFKNYEFHGACPKCGFSGNFKRVDHRSINVKDINIVKWDPNHIAVNHNPITNESEYFYTIPNDIKRRIRDGDRLFLDTIPWGFVEAVRDSQDFKFDRENIFHMRNMSAGQQINGIAVPPLISLFGLVFYQATLRKANEAVATDHMTPTRIIYPQAQTGNSDPVVAFSMANFTQRMKQAFRQRRQDANHIVFAPVPVGYQEVSGNGRSLLVSQEIEQAEQSILLALGVSRELLSGLTNWTSSTVGLRLLKNTLDCYVGQLEEFLDWLFERVSNYIGIESCKVSLVPFKLTDDDALRQMMVQLYQAGQLSKGSLFDALGIDVDEDGKRSIQDAINRELTTLRTEQQVNQAVFFEGRKIQQESKDSEYKDSLEKAYALTEQLLSADDPTRMHTLKQLELHDEAMYLMVSRLLERERRKISREAADAAAAQATNPEAGSGVVANEAAPTGPEDPAQ